MDGLTRLARHDDGVTARAESCKRAASQPRSFFGDPMTT